MTRTRIRTFQTALFGLLGLCGAQALCADYYAAPTGSNGNPGTAALPFKTIQKGVDAALDGDVIHVSAGTYRESIVWLN